ncbi:unnamed protein product [Caenorhabditis angaria]|uniref:Tyrosine-protein kinase ephrin type A/B receptor-like domain-containing protein n=1 Tax=Caenorhabditis angaria TaxID=860376 RepID=A0A9P1IPC0_9PELO|nr:unnamed protein product [Caenorhabditis angaria]
MLLKILALLILYIRSTVVAEYCQDSDFEFTYTNCDENGERWRVAVPRGTATQKTCGNLPQPQKGLNCSFSCPPGQYLDIDSQQCRACRAGFFSLGGGVRFEEFVTLPAGFSIDNFDADAAVAARQDACPKEAGWIVRDGELLYVPTPCVSRLSFSANLVRAGAVEYTYRMPRNNRALSMQIDVRNEQCQSYSDLAKSMLLKYTTGATESQQQREEKNGDWRRRTVELRTGQNVISWTVSNSYGLNGYTAEPIHFARIDVLGLAFTKECSACPPGTYSSTGAAECKPCAAGFFSSKGSAQCGQCPLSQYSGPKSSRCIDRPKCGPQDYYPVRTPCLANGTSRVVYEKVLPALCRDDVPGASRLPAPGPWQPCPKCNPGMAKNKEGICEFCRKDYHSDGNECTRCPVDTVPNYGLQYTNWQTLPPKLETRCEYISDDISEKCRIGDSWLANGDSLATPPSLERGIAFELVLSIDEGFWNPLAPKHMKVPVAQITIVFETSCADPSCVLYFIEDVSAGGGGVARKESFYRFLAAFNGTQSKRVWSHTVTKNTPAKYMLAFLRSGVAGSDDAITDVARIFAINVTNVGHRGGQGGGGSECLACPHSGNGDGCVPCPMGQYIHEETKLCVSCPANTIINATSSRIGAASCVACGQGLAPSTDGTSCVTPPRLTIRDPNPSKNLTYNYDFATWRDKNWTLEGVRVFSREGTAYYHAFRVALFQSIKCEEEYESSDVIGVMMDESMREAVDGMACRMTALPAGSGKNSSKTAFVSPLLLANKLDAITLNRTHKSWNITDHVLEYEGLDNKSLPLDVFFWFEQLSVATSATCPRGNIFVVVARCAPNKKTDEMRLPHSCPDGTCDGCMFVAILESSQACPICDKDDYETIRGECVGGKQTIHSIPHKHSFYQPLKKHSFFLGVASFITLSIILFLMCRRNQRLEYKYTRLIESKTGELPAAETCGIEEDEEDDELQDRVIFSKGSSSASRSRRGYSDRDSRDNAAFIALDNED